jgi:hypothetical protein
MEILQPGTVVLLWSALMVILIILFAIAQIHLLKPIFKDSTTKLIWPLDILYVPAAGSILYLVIGTKQKIKQVKQRAAPEKKIVYCSL